MALPILPSKRPNARGGLHHSPTPLPLRTPRWWSTPEYSLATPHEWGYRMKPEALAALRAYRGGKNALSLGPHHNNWTAREARLKTRALREGIDPEPRLAHMRKFARKVDMKIEILAAALYAEGYSVDDMALKSEALFGVKLSWYPLRVAVRKAFGVHYRALSDKQKDKFFARLDQAAKDGKWSYVQLGMKSKGMNYKPSISERRKMGEDIDAWGRTPERAKRVKQASPGRHEFTYSYAGQGKRAA